MKDYMPYEGPNDPFAGIDLESVVSGVDEDGQPVLAPEFFEFNTDIVGVPTLPIREPVEFGYRGETVSLLADVTHNLRISESFSGDNRGDGQERYEELSELFSELAVAYYAYRKGPGISLN